MLPPDPINAKHNVMAIVNSSSQTELTVARGSEHGADTISSAVLIVWF